MQQIPHTRCDRPRPRPIQGTSLSGLQAVWLCPALLPGQDQPAGINSEHQTRLGREVLTH